MTTSVSAKQCPECGKATVLRAALCAACGHQFRTRFVEPVNRTQAFEMVIRPILPERAPASARLFSPTVPVHRPAALRRFPVALLSSFLLIALAGTLLWLAWDVNLPSSRPALSAAAPTYLPSSSQAEHLYQAIGIAMSLYDLDRTAGGTGRILPVKDPHTLMISYDYSDHSVRVSLSRFDVTGDDYRVQAVALYQGKTLLQQHADSDYIN